jgi:hypothetical protein
MTSQPRELARISAALAGYLKEHADAGSNGFEQLLSAYGATAERLLSAFESQSRVSLRICTAGADEHKIEVSKGTPIFNVKKAAEKMMGVPAAQMVLMKISTTDAEMTEATEKGERLPEDDALIDTNTVDEYSLRDGDSLHCTIDGSIDAESVAGDPKSDTTAEALIRSGYPAKLDMSKLLRYISINQISLVSVPAEKSGKKTRRQQSEEDRTLEEGDEGYAEGLGNGAAVQLAINGACVSEAWRHSSCYLGLLRRHDERVQAAANDSIPWDLESVTVNGVKYMAEVRSGAYNDSDDVEDECYSRGHYEDGGKYRSSYTSVEALSCSFTVVLLRCDQQGGVDCTHDAKGTVVSSFEVSVHGEARTSYTNDSCNGDETESEEFSASASINGEEAEIEDRHSPSFDQAFDSVGELFGTIASELVSDSNGCSQSAAGAGAAASPAGNEGSSINVGGNGRDQTAGSDEVKDVEDEEDEEDEDGFDEGVPADAKDACRELFASALGSIESAWKW